MRYILCLMLCLITLPVFGKNTILVLGDSLSAGYGIDSRQGWVELLRQRLTAEKYDYEVVNASISGDTTRNGLARLPQALAAYQPAITIIELGGNDGLRGISLETLQQNLMSLIKLAQAAKSQVIVLGVRLPPNYGPEYTQRFQQIFNQLGKQPSVYVVPAFLRHIDDNTVLIQADGIHPTVAAQPQMLENVWPVIKKLLLQKKKR